MLFLGNRHTFARELELPGITEQVEHKGEVHVSTIDKQVLLLDPVRLEVFFELPTIIPGVVDVLRQLLGGIVHRFVPVKALLHRIVKSEECVHGVRRILPALRALIVLVELKPHIESLDIVVEGCFCVVCAKVN